MTKEMKALEDICPFCAGMTGEATLVLAPKDIVAQASKVIGNPCEKCQKLLKAGCIGFLSPSGEGLILQEDKGKEIMKKLGVGSFYVEDAMTIVRVRQQFWERQFKEIVDRRERIKEGREKKEEPTKDSSN